MSAPTNHVDLTLASVWVKEERSMPNEPNDVAEQERRQRAAMATIISVGAALGAALGAAVGNVGFGIAMGVAIGVAIGAAREARLR
jgi:hypothetical protein